MNDNKKLINIRITEKEKQRMETIAQKCGLSLSEYLRKRGLGFEPKPLLDDRAFSLYSELCKLSNLPLSPETEASLAALLRDLQQALFQPRKQSQKEIIEEVNGDPAKPDLWGEEDPRSADLLPLAAKEKDGG